MRMHTYSISTPGMEDYVLPKLFVIGSYYVFFWSNEAGEPIHVHVSVGKPSKNSAKIWLTRDGGCVLASNDAHIPAKDLDDLMEVISAQFFMICARWKEYFLVDTIRFYC